MSLAVVVSRALAGIDAPEVRVEVDLSNGLPGLTLVGLAETEVKESRERVRAALLNANFEFPTRRITLNLAPADLPKEGARFDLPIALGILAASGQIAPAALDGYEFIGELGLTGELRPVRGALVAALSAKAAGRTLVLPRANGAEAALVPGARVLVADHLLEVSAHFTGGALAAPEPARIDGDATAAPDLAEVRGQHRAKRALEIAAAGGHSLLFIGPPGSGKTMLASRLPGLLPPLSDAEALEAAAVQSVAHGAFDARHWRRRTFRSPHHTASAVALVGGGSQPRPGEISLAHHGVLFLDELPEFDRRVLEVLREPLESGRVTISRAARQAEFPARFQLVAAMNPCPCGYYGDSGGRCRCTPDQVRQYRHRLSGPLLDRIDMHVEVPAVPHGVLLDPGATPGEGSAAVRARVQRARERQRERGVLNSALPPKGADAALALDDDGRRLLASAHVRLRLSARGHHRILRLARTIADLAGADRIGSTHLSEAISYRFLDREANVA